MSEPKVYRPGPELLQAVRARFVGRGTSLHAWCRQSGVDWAYANRALTGEHTFPAAVRLRERIVAAAGLPLLSPARKAS